MALMKIPKRERPDYKGEPLVEGFCSNRITLHLYREREQLWKSFKEDAGTPQKREAKKMVKIVKKLRFAGEDITYVSNLILPLCVNLTL